MTLLLFLIQMECLKQDLVHGYIKYLMEGEQLLIKMVFGEFYRKSKVLKTNLVDGLITNSLLNEKKALVKVQVTSSSRSTGLLSSDSSSQSSSSDSGTSNFPGSNGGPNTAINSTKTNVINKNVSAPGVTHGNIQQKQLKSLEIKIISRIGSFRMRNE